MKLIVHGRHVEVTDWVREYVEKKVGKLERYLPQVIEARAELTHNQTRAASDRYTAELTMWVNQSILRAEESTGDVFASVDAVVDKMSRQIEHYKGKRFQGRRRAAHAAAAAANADAIAEFLETADETEEPVGEIVRVKDFTLEPMNELEALEQMELLGHDFFLFFNPEEGGANLVYRRRDGNYGLLKPRVP